MAGVAGTKRTALVATALLLAFCLPCAAARAAEGWTAAAISGYALGVEEGWARLTESGGAVRDTLEPDYGGFNYGTLMLAHAQLRGMVQRGTDDGWLADAAVAQILGTTAGPARGDPFHLLGATALLRDGQAGRLPASAWARIARPLSRWMATIEPFDGHAFASRERYDNWRLVYAAAGVELTATRLRGRPGSIAADRAAFRREVRWIVSSLMPRHAGPQLTTAGRSFSPGGARALSDPPWQPNAYHLFSTLLLERVHRSWPQALDRRALRIREDAGRYALALMAPDGQLTHVGRSAEQSWVLAAAADLGALRASEGGRDAPRWRAFAERALDRLMREHPTLADGTIPVVPGLLHSWSPAVMDGYASMTQYNGLTLFLLQDAIDNWPARGRAGTLPSDGVGALAADVARGGSGLVWGRAARTWWALSGRRTQADGRYQQGIVGIKVHGAGGWRELLATRPQRDAVQSGWLLRTPRGRARLVLDQVAGSGDHARLRGWWRLGGRPYRRARWEVRAGGGRVRITTEPLRRGESLAAAIWVRPGTVVRTDGGTADGLACTVTASGQACPQVLRFAGPGRPGVALSAGR